MTARIWLAFLTVAAATVLPMLLLTACESGIKQHVDQGLAASRERNMRLAEQIVADNDLTLAEIVADNDLTLAEFQLALCPLDFRLWFIETKLLGDSADAASLQDYEASDLAMCTVSGDEWRLKERE